VSVIVKGNSSSGKSITVDATVGFYPREAVLEMTAMSERAMVFNKEDYKHRAIVVYEAVALREGVQDNLTSYLIRSLLSEGRIEYPVTVRDKQATGPQRPSSRRARPTSSSPRRRSPSIPRTRLGPCH
jgi:hypothetical protein